MEKYLSIIEVPCRQEETFDEENVKFISSKISIWDFSGVPQSSYLASSTEEKSAMFKQYYKKSASKYYGKLFFCQYCFWFTSAVSVLYLIWYLVWYFFNFFFFVVGDHSPTEIDSGIFQEVRNANKISMTKNILGDNRIETTVTAEKLASREIPLTSGRNSGTLNNTLQLFVR